MRYFLVILLGLATCGVSHAKVRPASVFADNMVLQRETEVALWGSSDRQSVRITPSWNNQPVSVQVGSDGNWKTHVATPGAGGPYSITFDDGEKLVLSNILIGEVWICSGQSNMDMQVIGSVKDPISNTAEILSTAGQPNIRLLKLPRLVSGKPEPETKVGWMLSDSVNARAFSAVGFQFAQQLYQKLGVPIGIIHTAWGGTRIEAWMSRESLAPFDHIKFPADTAKVNQNSPSALFNGMVAPLSGFTVKGILWYQGEANLVNYAVYDRLMAAMVEGWKKAWRQSEMDFYYVQIAPFDYTASNRHGTKVPFLREAQEKAMKLIPRSFMVTTVDIGSKTTIHPPDKQTIARRLAAAALALTYNQRNTPYENAGYRSVKLKADKAIVTIENTYAGLRSGPDPEGFEVAGADRIFYPASVSVRKKKIVATSPEVKKVQAVRYCFRDWQPGTVHNSEGFPLLPFRTDDWPLPAN